MEEDEVLSSPFSAAEMWQRRPLHLLKETFGYHSLQKAERLSRVSAAWKYWLSFLAVFNKGVVFFRPGRLPPRDDDHDQKYWQGLYLMRETTMKHLVLVGFLPSAHAYPQDAQCMTFTESSNEYGQDLSYGYELLRRLGRTMRHSHHLLTIVTFYQGVCHPALQKVPRGKSGIRALFQTLSPLQSVVFAQCTYKVCIACVPQKERKTKDD
ncbi:hypothetical protein RvY_17494 [Ramazzottius varieornatus]|uniref:Uncharacterized protein n=1 Tax=Ramazzottius varieornatus TaxID=947166 RepID=A0A1D1W4H4_RAMVA|nr:hypothetical protein RvY_17494 [Ramazzottius varieornatus]